MAGEVFKILNKLSPSYIQDLVNEKVSIYNLRNKKKVDVPQVNTTRYGMKSYSGLRLPRRGTVSLMSLGWRKTMHSPGGFCILGVASIVSAFCFCQDTGMRV